MEQFRNKQIEIGAELGFKVDALMILENPIKVADFFGDNRNFYKQLRQGSSTVNRVNLDSFEDYDTDLDPQDMKIEDRDLPPLEPKLINEAKAEHIAKFFEQNHLANAAFLQYISVEEGKI